MRFAGWYSADAWGCGKAAGPGVTLKRTRSWCYSLLIGVGIWKVYEWIATFWKAVEARYPEGQWVEVWWTPIFRPDVIGVRFLWLLARPKGRVLRNAGISLARSVV